MNRCVMCGKEIPEGRMVCLDCSWETGEMEEDTKGETNMSNYVWQERWKSWALWTSIAALVVFCVKEFAGLDISETVDKFLDVLLPVLVAFGVVNNPTSKNTL